MAEPVSSAILALVKPILKELTKAILAKTTASATAGKVVGLTAKEVARLSNLELLNIARAKVVDYTKVEVARSLGMTTKELVDLIKNIKLPDNVKKAVKGRNYINTVKQLIDDPESTLTRLGKKKIIIESRKIGGRVGKEIEDTTNESLKGKYQKIQLDLMQGALLEISNELVLDRILWDNAHTLDLDHIDNVRYGINQDISATISAFGFLSEIPYMILTTESGGEGGGFKNAIDFTSYLNHIESLLLDGYAVTPNTDIL